MAKETLRYKHVVGSSSKADFRVKSIQFGDGYHQRAPDGIHTDLRSYTLEFRGLLSFIEEVDSFFSRHKGVASFKWKAPDRLEERFYICGGMKQSFITSTVRGLSVEIKESLT